MSDEGWGEQFEPRVRPVGKKTHTEEGTLQRGQQGH